jgi:hypothetical protein
MNNQNIEQLETLQYEAFCNYQTAKRALLSCEPASTFEQLKSLAKLRALAVAYGKALTTYTNAKNETEPEQTDVQNFLDNLTD